MKLSNRGRGGTPAAKAFFVHSKL